MKNVDDSVNNGDIDNTARQRIVEAAVAAIDTGGEAAVRISTVARDAGVTQGMISYYFGGREGLIQEAQLIRFSSAVTDDIKVLEKKGSRNDRGPRIQRVSPWGDFRCRAPITSIISRHPPHGHWGRPAPS